MKRFAFRLETVLKVRRAKLQAVEREFAGIRHRLLAKEGEIASLEREQEEIREQLRDIRLNEKTRLAVNSLRAYLQGLWIGRQNAQQDLTAIGEELHIKRSELVEGRRQVKALERLREHRIAEWQRAADREEQKVLDDLRAVPRSSEILRMDDERKADAG